MARAHSPSSEWLLRAGVVRWTDRRTRHLLSGVHFWGWERQRTAAQIHLPGYEMSHKGHEEGGLTDRSATGSHVTETRAAFR